MEDERLSALRGTGLLDSPPEHAFDRMTSLVRRLLGVPVSLVSLVAADRQFFKSSTGLPEPWATLRQTPLSHSFCQHVVASREPLIISDAREHPLVCDNLAIRDLNVIAYLGIPLLESTGQAIGSLCAITSQPRNWSADDVEVMKELAALVMTEIELKYHLRQRIAAEAALEQANASKDRFFSILSHDLRGPVGTFLMLARSLRDNLESFEAALVPTLLDRLAHSAENLYQLLENLLAWARLQIGGVPYHPRRFNLEDLSRDLADLLAEQAAEKKIDLAVNVAARTHAWGDPNMIRSVLLNLLSNGIKFTESGGTVTLDAHASDASMVVSVRDTGVGMREEQVAQLFRLDTALSTPGTADERGSGLGLIICKEMLDMHGVPLDVARHAGGGMAFSFTLASAPAQDPENAAEDGTPPV